LTFSDGTSGTIGTYLVNGTQPTSSQSDRLTVLTDADRQIIISNAHHADENIQAWEEHLAKTENEGSIDQMEQLQYSSEESEEGLRAQRIQEWRYVKDLPETLKEVKIDLTFSSQKPGTSASGSEEDEIISTIQDIQLAACQNVQTDFIEGVSEDPYDVWYKYIAVLNNQHGYCSPISATMVLRYFAMEQGFTSLFQEPAPPSSSLEEAWKRAFEEDQNISWAGLWAQRSHAIPDTQPDTYLQLAVDLKRAMKTKDNGTDVDNIADGLLSVYQQHTNTYYGWKLGKDRSVQRRNSGKRFVYFQQDIRKNFPGIISVLGHAGWPVNYGNGGHSMPVIGTRQESRCGKQQDRHWIYVHSTWGRSDKRWYRFDMSAYPKSSHDAVYFHPNS